MQPWVGEGLGGGQVLVEDVPEVLDDLGDDARAAGRGVREVHGAVRVLDDGGADGGEGAGVGFDEVCWGRGVAECVGCVGDAEI